MVVHALNPSCTLEEAGRSLSSMLGSIQVSTFPRTQQFLSPKKQTLGRRERLSKKCGTGVMSRCVIATTPSRMCYQEGCGFQAGAQLGCRPGGQSPKFKAGTSRGGVVEARQGT